MGKIGGQMPRKKEELTGLLPTQVEVARELYRSKLFGIDELAKKYGVHRNTISRAIHGETWAWVPGAVPREGRA
jgi:hypothetical protein